MTSKKSDDETKAASTPSAAEAGSKSSSADAGAAEVQQTVDEAEEKGYIGEEVDQTPNEAYTLKGVTSGQPTPETDAEAKAKATAKEPPK